VLPPGVGRAVVADKTAEVEGERDEVDDEFNELVPPTVEVESGGLICLVVEYELELDFVMIKSPQKCAQLRVCEKEKKRINNIAPFCLSFFLTQMIYIEINYSRLHIFTPCD
jgi:hypothetical protein